MASHSAPRSPLRTPWSMPWRTKNGPSSVRIGVEDHEREAEAEGRRGTGGTNARSRKRSAGAAASAATSTLGVVVGRRQLGQRGEQLGRGGQAPCRPAPAARRARRRGPPRRRWPWPSGRRRRRRPRTGHSRSAVATRPPVADGDRRDARRRRRPGPASSSRYSVRAGQQLVVGALVDHPAAGRPRTMRSARRRVERRWATRIVVRPCHHVAQRGVDLLLGRGVDRRRGVVEHQDPRVGEERPGQGDALALAARQGEAPLADDGVVAVGQARDELVGLGRRGRRPATSSSVASGRP